MTVVVSLYVVLPPGASGGVASITCTESQHPDLTKRPAPISGQQCEVEKLAHQQCSRTHVPFLISQHDAKPFSRSHMYTDEIECAASKYSSRYASKICSSARGVS